MLRNVESQKTIQVRKNCTLSFISNAQIKFDT